MKVWACVVALVKALQEAEPVRDKAHRNVVAICSSTRIIRKFYFGGNFPILFRAEVETIDDSNKLQGSDHRCDDIGQEEMPESHKAKWWDKYVP